MRCTICSHSSRREIEEYLSVVDTPGVTITLKEISDRFRVDLRDLQVHALMHTPLLAQIAVSDERAEGAGEVEVIPSVAAGLKKAEATILNAVAEEYFRTLRVTGKELRSRVSGSGSGVTSDATGDVVLPKVLPKEMVDLYIGAGNNLRQTIASIVDMNQKLNGESDPALESFKALVQAIRAPGASEAVGASGAEVGGVE